MPIPVTTTTALARHLLCAVPQLEDPNFKRSVVLMLEHTASEGAFGLVINSQLTTKVSDVVESLDFTWLGEADALVRRGGPVEPIRGFVLHDQPDWDPMGEEILPGLHLTTSLDGVSSTGVKEIGGEGARLQFMLGYAGWGSGQLEGEMAIGSWVSVPIRGATAPADGLGVDPSWILTANPDDMWIEALRATGIDPARVVALGGRRPSHAARG